MLRTKTIERQVRQPIGRATHTKISVKAQPEKLSTTASLPETRKRHFDLHAQKLVAIAIQGS